MTLSAGADEFWWIDPLFCLNVGQLHWLHVRLTLKLTTFQCTKGEKKEDDSEISVISFEAKA